jgi:sugar phosphate isomerase/epimerase
MKIGWCAPLQQADLVKEVGMDFLEVPLAPMGLEDKTTFDEAKRELAECPISTAAFNMFLPQDMRVVGPDTDDDRLRTYLGRASDLMSSAGADIVVFGSGWARNVPDDWERARGEDQFLRTLSWCADVLHGTGTTLVIEPLNRKESNIVNSVADGVRFAQQVNRAEIRVLADFYHMDEEQEPLETLNANGAWLSHIHVADTGRRNPGTGSYDYDRFFDQLKNANYTGMISAECNIEHPTTDMRHSLAFLRKFEREFSNSTGRT